jgi:branched-chain amino acid transport system substrate-binding protein
VAQLEAMKGFKGISGEISYAPFDPQSPACRQGQKQVFLVECLADGKAKRLTPWMTID